MRAIDTLAWTGVRYALGRRTYVVGDVTDAIAALVSKGELHRDTKGSIITDIERAEASDGLGDPDDARRWLALRDALEGDIMAGGTTMGEPTSFEAEVLDRLKAVEEREDAARDAWLDLQTERDQYEVYTKVLETHLREHGCDHDLSAVANEGVTHTDSAGNERTEEQIRAIVLRTLRDMGDGE